MYCRTRSGMSFRHSCGTTNRTCSIAAVSAPRTASLSRARGDGTPRGSSLRSRSRMPRRCTTPLRSCPKTSSCRSPCSGAARPVRRTLGHPHAPESADHIWHIGAEAEGLVFLGVVRAWHFFLLLLFFFAPCRGLAPDRPYGAGVGMLGAQDDLLELRVLLRHMRHDDVWESNCADFLSNHSR